MKIIVFTDLDDTLFQTLEKCHERGEKHFLLPAAQDQKGQDRSFTTWQQRSLIQWIKHANQIIPVTGRNLSAFKRVHMQADGTFGNEKILHHGALILNEQNRVNQTWNRRTKNILEPLQTEFISAYQSIQTRSTASIAIRTEHLPNKLICAVHLRRDQSVSYKNFKELGHQLTEQFQDESQTLRVLTSQNALSILPRHHGKREATQFVKEKYADENTIFVGIGDNPLDEGIFASCDYALIPTYSDLYTKHFGER